MQSITIDVVSDVACPWCYLGMKRLESAVASLDGIDATVAWRPYQLDPSIPAGGVDRKAYMLKKFGDPSRIQSAHERLTELGRAEGIAFHFDDMKVAANTLDAHRLIRWAGAKDADTQARMVARLFALNFEEGADIGDRAVLIEAAADVGLDPAVVESLLATDADRAAVEEEIATASRMGITGVPCFLLDGKYAVMGAQDVATMADAIAKVAGAKVEG